MTTVHAHVFIHDTYSDDPTTRRQAFAGAAEQMSAAAKTLGREVIAATVVSSRWKAVPAGDVMPPTPAPVLLDSGQLVHLPGDVTLWEFTGETAACVPPGAEVASVLAEVAAERARQDAKWGEQNHPDGTGPDVVWVYSGPASWVAQSAKNSTDEAAELGLTTFRDILLEEVAEAFAEEDPAKVRTELVQVAAVATQWVEAIDRRTAVVS